MLRGGIQSVSPTVRASAVKPTLGVQRSLSVGQPPNPSSTAAHSILPSSEKLTLPLFVKSYNDHLPLVVRVCRGYCGPNEEMSISEGDRFNVHFVKQTKVVRMTYDNGSQYNVPLNSSIPFGIVYDPTYNVNQAVKGFRFERVAEILQKNPLPKVIRARKAYQGSSPDSSVVSNELMVVLGTKSKLRGKQLKVFSLTLGREKVLSENCTGHFSTKPRDICLYLPEIMNHVPDVFPCKAVMFTPAEADSKEASGKLQSFVVTLMHSSIESSLVATSILEEDPENARLLDIPIDLDILVRVVGTDEIDDHKLYENTTYFYSRFDPSNLALYVNTRGSHEVQSMLYANVRRDTQGGYKGVDLVKPLRVPPSAQTYRVPSRPDIRARPLPPEPFQMHSRVSPPPIAEEGEYNLTRHPNSKLQRSTRASAGSSASDYSYVDIDSLRVARVTPPTDIPYRRTASTGSSDSSFSGRSPNTPGLADGMSTDGSAGGTVCKNAENTGSGSSMGVVEIRSRTHSASSRSSCSTTHSLAFESMLSELDDLSRQLSVDDTEKSATPSDPAPGVYTLANRVPIPETPSTGTELNLNHTQDERKVEEDIYEPMNPMDPAEAQAVIAGRNLIEKNRHLLKTLDSAQVLSLLEAMGMTEHQEKFTEHHINGDILSECDEDILRDELHVTKRLDRMRLLKVISGQYSVQELFLGRDGYVTMLPARSSH